MVERYELEKKEKEKTSIEQNIIMYIICKHNIVDLVDYILKYNAKL